MFSKRDMEKVIDSAYYRELTKYRKGNRWRNKGTDMYDGKDECDPVGEIADDVREWLEKNGVKCT